MIAILQSYSSMLLGALGKTLLLTLLSLLFAMIIGMIFALMNVGRNRVLNCIGTIYVDAVRGVPLIVLAYFIYFGVPSGMKMMGATDFRAQCTSGRYDRSCDELRCLYGGRSSVQVFRVWTKDRWRQVEASDFPMQKYAAGYPATERSVRWFRSIINQFIITLKDTSILSVIGFPELTNMGKTIAGNTFKSLQTWAIVGIMYMIVIVALSKLCEENREEDRPWQIRQ